MAPHSLFWKLTGRMRFKKKNKIKCNFGSEKLWRGVRFFSSSLHHMMIQEVPKTCVATICQNHFSACECARTCLLMTIQQLQLITASCPMAAQKHIAYPRVPPPLLRAVVRQRYALNFVLRAFKDTLKRFFCKQTETCVYLTPTFYVNPALYTSLWWLAVYSSVFCVLPPLIVISRITKKPAAGMCVASPACSRVFSRVCVWYKQRDRLIKSTFSVWTHWSQIGQCLSFRSSFDFGRWDKVTTEPSESGCTHGSGFNLDKSDHS